jgi:hypothetical protein
LLVTFYAVNSKKQSENLHPYLEPPYIQNSTLPSGPRTREPGGYTLPAVSEKTEKPEKPEKKVSKPVWFKNTYFWIAGILFILGIVGLIAGENSIRDPGQKREHGLAWLYFVGAIIMLVNGFISHSQTVQHYQETLQAKE